MPTPHPRSRRLTVHAVRFVALAGFVALLSYRGTTEPPAPEPTPEPSIVVAAGEIGILGAATPDLHERLRTRISVTLRDVYEQGFLSAPEPDGETTPTPAPSPGPQLADSFTTEAGRAVRADDAVFRAPRDVRVLGGRVAFDGVAVVDDAGAVSAWLELTFSADGTTSPTDEGRPVRAVELAQRGHLLLVDVGNGLLVAGYDLELSDRREVRRGGPQALVQARWMP